MNLTRDQVRAGVFLSEVGGLPPLRSSPAGALAAAAPNPKLLPGPGQPRNLTSVAPTPSAATSPAAPFPDAPIFAPDAWSQQNQLSPSLAAVLRPQAAYRWLLPGLASITPLYIENILRGALAGNHVQAWELFDLMIDANPELAACIGEYVDGVSEKKVVVEPYHEEDEQPTPTAVRNQKMVAAALRNMRPDPAADENALRQTVRDILFGRFHGQSILEEDWYDTYGTGQLNRIDVPGVGSVVAPRCTFWVHPVCYAWDISGRLGLRVALDAQIKDLLKKSGKSNPMAGRAVGMAEPPAWNWISSQPMPSYIQEFPKNKFLIAILKAKTGTALGGSCLRPLAWWFCVQNFCGDWLLDLAQLFGIPFRKGKYAQGTPETEKAEAREMLQNMGARGWCLFDERVTVDFEKAMEQGDNSPQGFMMRLAEQQMRKVILRQTMTGKDSSTGKGFGEQEGDVKGQCLNAGAQFACEVLREQMARHILLVNLGTDAELPFISMLDEDEGGMEEAQTLQALSTAGAGQIIPLDWIGKRFGIPKPTKGQKTLADGIAAGAANNTPPPAAGNGQPGQGEPKTPDPNPGMVPPPGKTPTEASQLTAAAPTVETLALAAKDLAAGETAILQNPVAAHYTNYCSCGQVISQCRCSGAARTISVTKNGCRDCRAANQPVEAAFMSPAHLQAHDLAATAGAALAETVAPLVKYLKAGLAISDPAAQRAYFERAIAKWPELTSPLKHDTALQEALTPALVKTFVEGLAGPAAGAAEKPKLEAGDVPGHDFHGNQYSDAGGGNPGGGRPVAARDMADVVAQGKTRHAKAFFKYADVAPGVVESIAAAGGPDLKGYQHLVEADAVRKVLRDHGSDHLPVTEKDFDRLAEVVQSPDKVFVSRINERGMPMLQYEKRFNGTTVVVEEVRTGKKKLSLKTMYKKPSRGL